MPVASGLRRSLPYLLLKTYTVASLVSLFASRPITSRLGPNQLSQLRRLEELRAKLLQDLSDAHKQISQLSPRVRYADTEAASTAGKEQSGRLPGKSWLIHDQVRDLEIRKGKLGPAACPSPTMSADTRPPSERSSLRGFTRWMRQISQVNELMRRDDTDYATYPETRWHATVRYSSQKHRAEEAFLLARADRIAQTSLCAFLQLPEDAEIHPADVPIVSIAGSGGGYRAMFGLSAFLETLKREGVWDVTAYLAGVSGSCWTIATLFTTCGLSMRALLDHWLRMARERLHPLNRQALAAVMATARGPYFLLAPLLRKARAGFVGVGVMDIYATVVTSYQLLPRQAPAELSRRHFKWSCIWDRFNLRQGQEPLPILSAVRVIPERDLPYASQHAPAALPDGRRRNAEARQAARLAGLRFEWFEMTPLEIGSADLMRFVPTWSWGRKFHSGHSFNRPPEQSLAMILGQCTSAPAGPLTAYIDALLASIPTDSIMSLILSRINHFAKMRHWKRRWANPIRAAHEPNPFYGSNDRSINPTDPCDARWEEKGRLKLMDAGLSNNLPHHILACAHRKSDVIISFDASSDVQTAAVARIHDFGEDRGYAFSSSASQPLPPHPLDPDGRTDARGNMLRKALTADETDDRYRAYYAQVLHGWAHGQAAAEERPPDLRIVYCPLLPSAAQPDFDPATAPFSTSYNLVWTPEQVAAIYRTVRANTERYVLAAAREQIREAYFAKRAARLARERQRAAQSDAV